MAEQIRYGHYLHGGDYNPEQWLDSFHGDVVLGSAGAGRGEI